ncbi:MAG: hypothetical protein BGO45_03775 [Microbacterium sp. 71-36]|uniref:hypothetical protein n=1 Tax=unclassified Microbacterium TaxID=2609290 RepID=UPI000869F73C|nr:MULTISPECIES: hypothetical protein [unclassified Microbacterium]MBN9210880.1 hypothetical protein [Microbacterium sp.]ODT37238.1 MAG: hypothetical protein ABS60_13710 [Microbacterium sp. SCN 71-17]ODU50265.1 MAG: hypothetical protein ABT07_03575 [Microbacterium sp. SCN 70-10]OJV75632.1 MAG: hypothetical protein BGO45_03775 [Microbacterium sp. 71-36]
MTERLHAVTLVVDMPIAKIDALDVIAFAADGGVDGARTSQPRVWLAPHAWAEVEIPKFADPPPFAIDVLSDVSGEIAWAQAHRLHAALERLGWTVDPPRAGVR